MSKKVLIIEDDHDIADLLQIHLRDLDMQLDRAEDGMNGLQKALDEDYELVILDIMLPGMDGLEVCRRIRERKRSLPILMLTAKSEEFDKVLGLELGADDYMTKPFSIRELLARIKSIIRRVNTLREEKKDTGEPVELKFADLIVNLEKRKVTLRGKTIELTAKEFDLLALFASRPGKAYSRENLLNIVWGYQFSGYEHTVNSHINRLRAKIEGDPSNPQYIKTVWGVGYKFAEEEEIED
ncbi:MAG TPA: response regulator transcription factor [Calditrichaeota bacterium]|nr:response regulator transcription factor [Calditrichota bacterium]